MYKRIIIVTITLLLLASGCLSDNKSQDEIAKESDAGNAEMLSATANSSPDNQSVNESEKSSTVVSQPHKVVVPPHTATEIVYQGYGDDLYGNYLLLNTTEHTYFENQTGTDNDYAGNYKETSQTYNLDSAFGTTDVFIKGDNCVTFDAVGGGKGVWKRVD